MVKKLSKDAKVKFVFFAILAGAFLFAYTNYMYNARLAVEEKSYNTLLELIADAESNGNYNAYYGHPTNSEIRFTEMTVAEVLNWQSEFVQQGSPSSAVGKYQMLNTTLARVADQLGIERDQKFDQPTQDKLAIALLEIRGSERYVNKELSVEEFAANLAKEWAALPRVIGGNPTSSYYASDGLNKSRVSINEVLGAIKQIRSK